jgi:hypothetical protein
VTGLGSHGCCGIQRFLSRVSQLGGLPLWPAEALQLVALRSVTLACSVPLGWLAVAGWQSCSSTVWEAPWGSRELGEVAAGPSLVGWPVSTATGAAAD